MRRIKERIAAVLGVMPRTWRRRETWFVFSAPGHRGASREAFRDSYGKPIGYDNGATIDRYGRSISIGWDNASRILEDWIDVEMPR